MSGIVKAALLHTDRADDSTIIEHAQQALDTAASLRQTIIPAMVEQASAEQ